MTDIEHRLREAFGEARATTNASPDLFARVQRSLEVTSPDDAGGGPSLVVCLRSSARSSYLL